MIYKIRIIFNIQVGCCIREKSLDCQTEKEDKLYRLIFAVSPA